MVGICVCTKLPITVQPAPTIIFSMVLSLPRSYLFSITACYHIF